MLRVQCNQKYIPVIIKCTWARFFFPPISPYTSCSVPLFLFSFQGNFVKTKVNKTNKTKKPSLSGYNKAFPLLITFRWIQKMTHCSLNNHPSIKPSFPWGNINYSVNSLKILSQVTHPSWTVCHPTKIFIDSLTWRWCLSCRESCRGWRHASETDLLSPVKVTSLAHG